MGRTVWARGSAVSFTVLVCRPGVGPFHDRVRTVAGRAPAAAAGLAVLTTVSCARRWRIVAGGLDVDLPRPAAVALYYGSLFLNVTLPGRPPAAYPDGMSLSQPSRTIVVEPVQDATGAPASIAAPPSATGEAFRRAGSPTAPSAPAQAAGKQ